MNQVRRRTKKQVVVKVLFAKLKGHGDIGLDGSRQKRNIALEVFDDLLIDISIQMKRSIASKDVEHNGKLMKRRM